MITNSSACSTTVDSKSSSSGAEENQEGQLGNRSVGVSEQVVDRVETLSQTDQVSAELMTRVVDIEPVEYQQIIEMQGVQNHGELINEYMALFRGNRRNLFRSYLQGLGLQIGYLDRNSVLCFLHRSIYNRLLKIGLVMHQPDQGLRCIILPMLKAGNFNIIDRFKWFCRDSEIDQKFQKIVQYVRTLLLLEDIVYKKIEKYDCASDFIQDMTKEEILDWIDRRKKVWTIISDNTLYLSKVHVYMLFEHILDHISDTWDTLNNCYSKKSKDSQVDHLERSFRISMGFLELLLPYAIEITKAFGIDLQLDKQLLIMRIKGKQMVSRLSIDEYQEYQDLEQEVAEIARKEAEEEERQKQIEVNKAISTQRAKDLWAARKQAEIERRTRGKEKVKERKNHNANIAQNAVNKFREEDAKKQEAKTTARKESQYKIHDLPSEDFVQNTIIANLSADDVLVMETVFGELDYDYTISHKNAVNLAKNIKKVLDDHNIGCAKDFYNYLIRRIHYVHDPDKGDLLPRHYVDILRACFVIFRIWLKGWAPKTKEDFDAMEKCLQRQADAFHAKMSQ